MADLVPQDEEKVSNIMIHIMTTRMIYHGVNSLMGTLILMLLSTLTVPRANYASQ